MHAAALQVKQADELTRRRHGPRRIRGSGKGALQGPTGALMLAWPGSPDLAQRSRIPAQTTTTSTWVGTKVGLEARHGGTAARRGKVTAEQGMAGLGSTLHLQGGQWCLP